LVRAIIEKITILRITIQKIITLTTTTLKTAFQVIPIRKTLSIKTLQMSVKSLKMATKIQIKRIKSLKKLEALKRSLSIFA